MLNDLFEVIKKDHVAKFTLIYFLIFSVWWVALLLAGSTDGNQNTWWGSIYPLIAFVGGMTGLVISKKWGGWSSAMGKAIIAFSLGLLFQFFGQVFYTTYFLVTGGDVPYPSLGDVGYFGSIPLYIFGVYHLGRAAGIKINSRAAGSIMLAIAVLALMLAVSYFLFVRNYEPDWTNMLGALLDFAYPFGQAIYVSLAILIYLLSRKTLGGIMRTRVLFILLALMVQYLADYTFLYLIRGGQYYAAGPTDYLYFLSYTMMTLGILYLKTTATKLQNNEVA